MDCKRLLDFKILFTLLYIAIFSVGCSTSEMIQDQIENTVKNSKIEDALLTNDGNLLEGESRTNPIIVSYKNASSNVQISLYPNKDEFYLDLKGFAPSEKDSIIIVDSTLINNRARDIQTLLSSYRKAQDLFYLGEYRNALAEVDKTLEIQETADAYALKGTIFFMMENPTAARANWNKAVQMDPNIPVPSIPELEVLINEIREVNGQ